MRVTTLFFALLFAAPLIAQTLPRADLTPGLTRPLTVNQVCTTKWGLDHRFVTEEMKKQVCKAYGAAECPGPKWELDHLIPRELGGADDVKNIWPQPIAEAKVKDRVENWAHLRVCAGELNRFNYFQKQFAVDWRVLYGEYLAERKPRAPRPSTEPH
jgi:hypothetical protein